MRVVIDLQGCQSPDGRIRGVGRYCLSLCRAMASESRGHEVWVALNGAMPDSVVLVRDLLADVLPSERVIAWDSVAPTASMVEGNRSRNLAAEALRESFLEGLGADVVFTASMIDGWVDSVVTSVPERSRAFQVAVLYDLIPLVMPDFYLTKEGISSWYMRKLEHLKRCDLLLGISASTCREAIELLGTDERRIVNISAAVGEEFRILPGDVTYASVGRKHGIVRPFVMYAGGFDHRKNLSALINAYADLPGDIRERHQLVFVGNIDIKERNELSAARERAGLAPNDLVFTGFVSNDELISLYNASALYAFPSLHEGFGLPALEAMSCGAVVLGADATSLPEVIGVDEALFDPSDVRSISAKLFQGLTDEAFRERMRAHAATHIKKFSWASSAKAAWTAIEGAVRDRVVEADAGMSKSLLRDRRVAVLASAELHADLKAAVESIAGSRPTIHVFSGPVSLLSGDALPAGWKSRGLADFVASEYDEVIVQVSNETAVAHLLVAAKETNAALVAIDRNVDQVLDELLVLDRALLIAMIYGGVGYCALSRIDGSASSPNWKDVDASVLVHGYAGWRIVVLGGAADAQIRQITDLRLLVSRLARTHGVSQWSAEEVSRLAMAVAGNQPKRGQFRTLFVDISHLVIEDAKTGIQRVVRHIVAELMAAPVEGFHVEPVYIKPDGVFRYARKYCQGRFYPELPLPEDELVTFQSGDIFIGLDLAAHLVPYLRDTYTAMRSRGVEIQFVVYDLLPLLRPDCFDENGLPTFRLWYEAIAEISDGIICISRTVADEFKQWLPQSMPARVRPLKIGYFHLGADLAPGAGGGDKTESISIDLAQRPTFLMVGTIEPRKGHAQALDALELLWAAGHDVNLVLIGKPGWRVEGLTERLRQHVEKDRRLFWLERASDDELIGMYQSASALLAASEGEGFGLPLIEAAQYGLPIIARDLPVFLEVAGEHAHYFSGMAARPMADAIEQWLQLNAKGEAPASSGLPWITWEQSARQLEAVSIGGHWYDAWSPEKFRHFKASDYRGQSTAGELVRGYRQTRGRSGLLFASPPVAVTRGTYRLRIVGERTSSSGLAWADVEAHGGAWRLGSVPLGTGEGEIASLELQVKEDVLDLAVRIMVDGEASLEFRSLDLMPVAGGIAP